MVPPNFFRFVRKDITTVQYQGYTLELNATFENPSWRIGSYTANYGSDLKLTETFESGWPDLS